MNHNQDLKVSPNFSSSLKGIESPIPLDAGPKVECILTDDKELARFILLLFLIICIDLYLNKTYTQTKNYF